MYNIQLPVRHLVEFILRSGSIDTGFFIMSNDRALDGTKVHNRIQRTRKKEAEAAGGTYKKEVRLSAEYVFNDITFELSGRADGVYITDGCVVIDEIKSVTNFENLPSDSELPSEQVLLIQPTQNQTSQDQPAQGQPAQGQPVSETNRFGLNPLHLAQARCYGYMYCASNGCDENSSIALNLIYGHIETDACKNYTESFTFSELTAFVNGLIEKYYEFAKMDIERIAEAIETGEALSFPFGQYRKGQRELAVSVYAAIKQEKKIFVQAPTGIGKTISTLFPAVKAVSKGLGDRIFYVTSKTVQRNLAEDALSRMENAGLKIRSVTLTAKDKICFKETRVCNPDYCEYANGHFDRVNAAILDCIKNETLITRAVAEDYAQKHMVCPSEFVLDLSLFCHIVVCDYNHVYDPKAKLKRFFTDGGDFILLQDEAHNLVDRSREMFSASLHRRDFTSLRKLLKSKHPLYKSLGAVAKAIDDDPLNAALVFTADCELWFANNQDDDILSLYFTVMDYIYVSDLYDERYTTLREDGSIKLYCLDPSFLLAKEQKKSRSCVFFSATLSPLHYFQKILGGDEDDFKLRLGSPFPRENVCIAVDSRISTKYKHRDMSLNAVADSLYNMVNGENGNYIAFFPSYAYLEQVFNVFTQEYGDIEAVRQQQGESDFILHFESERSADKFLGFAVLGGAFSEGIDLVGNRLIGAAIVGVGMPQISAERDIIADYFNKEGKRGFDYAYVYPGMIKVMQAAGRVIRTEQDRGVILLIDSRYAETDYKDLLPPEWGGYVRLSAGRELRDVLQEFWQGL